MATASPNIGLVLLVMAFVGHGTSVEAQDAHRVDPAAAEGAERAVESLVKDYIEAWNAHDMEAWERLFTPDSDFVNRRGGWWSSRAMNVRGHADVHEMLIDRGVAMDMEADLASVDLLAPGIALAHVRTAWPGMATPADEGPPGAIMTWIVVERDGTWRIRAVQNTLVEVGPGPS